MLVSPADSRVVVFPTISDATKLWIKGKTFSLETLLGDSKLASEFNGGAIAIFRLAPQDYHRFHFPVGGVVGETTKLPGAYFTVNPMAVRSPISVYDQNIRAITPIETKEFGKVLFISVGATCVASIAFTSKVGSTVKK